MNKYSLPLLVLLFIFIITACSNNSDEITTLTEDYVSQWNKQDFEQMYLELSNQSKEKYPKSEFVDRYKKIYKDIEVDNLNVVSEFPEQLDLKKDTDSVDIPIEISLDSLAGPISFTEQLTLVHEEKTNDTPAGWKIDWHPGLIFPELKDGGKISIRPLMPERGEILDRNDKQLALNEKAYEIGVIPETLNNAQDEKEKLSKILNIKEKDIDQALNASWVEDNLFVPLKIIKEDDTNTIDQLSTLSAAILKEVSIRSYPYDDSAAHLIGYLGRITADEMKKYTDYGNDDLVGKRGLEKLYEKELKGIPGAEIIINQPDDSDLLLAKEPPKNGQTLKLTLDIELQQSIFNAFNKKAGTATAINPISGEVLALVSSPAFDPNTFLMGINQNEWDKLDTDSNLPLINRFASTFAPGSVIKPITAAIGLKNKTINPNEAKEIDGLTWGKDSWGNSKVKRVSESTAPVNLRDALVNSDNIYFAMNTVEMGADKFISGLKEFGFESEIPSSYPIQKSSISKDSLLSDEALLAHTSYGQGQIEMSALHLASSYAAILNEGTMLKPRILSSDKKEIWNQNLITKNQALELQENLRSVVTQGTGKAAQKANFPIAGKTGTAELKSSLTEDGLENGWFVGYPDDNHNIIISMMIEDVKKEGGSSFVVEKVTDILIDARK